jgi:hypothetical protein
MKNKENHNLRGRALHEVRGIFGYAKNSLLFNFQTPAAVGQGTLTLCLFDVGRMNGPTCANKENGTL